MHVRLKKTSLYIVGILVIIIGIMISIIPIFLQKKELKIEYDKIDDYILETTKKNEVDFNNIENIDNSNEIVENEEKYSMVLEIPKIRLKKGIYDVESKYNSIEYNVAIVKESSMPDEESNNLILAAHNGTTKISYFTNLHKLDIGDRAIVYFNGYKYTYEVEDIYDVLKDGDVEINRDENKNTLTLVTCKKSTNDRQLVIILYLIEKIEY